MFFGIKKLICSLKVCVATAVFAFTDLPDYNGELCSQQKFFIVSPVVSLTCTVKHVSSNPIYPVAQ